MIFILGFLTVFSLKGDKLKVENVWMRPAAMDMNSALYFDIENNSAKPDTLYKVYSNLAQLAQIHESYKKDDMMAMREVKFVVIAPHSKFQFKPMGHHVMFILLKKDMKQNDYGEVALYFKNAGKIKVKALVKRQ